MVHNICKFERGLVILEVRRLSDRGCVVIDSECFKLVVIFFQSICFYLSPVSSSVSILYFWWWQQTWEQSEKQQEPINSFISTLGRREGGSFRLLPLKWFLFISPGLNVLSLRSMKWYNIMNLIRHKVKR